MGKKDEEIERLKNLNESQRKTIANSKQKIQELTDHRQLMVLNVNVTGIQDIDKCLKDATSLVASRLEELKKQDDFVILAVPHTMTVNLPG